ncbi:MAG: hypothetical protein ONB05_06325, partial [candidate division KSB1 bacterium]|nr:hypothetical protein [candidate division KSB1 bacterium]
IVEALPSLAKKALAGNASNSSFERAFDGPEMSVLEALDLEPNGLDDQAQDVANGVYLYQLKAGDFVATRKLVLVR